MTNKKKETSEMIERIKLIAPLFLYFLVLMIGVYIMFNVAPDIQERLSYGRSSYDACENMDMLEMTGGVFGEKPPHGYAVCLNETTRTYIKIKED